MTSPPIQVPPLLLCLFVVVVVGDWPVGPQRPCSGQRRFFHQKLLIPEEEEEEEEWENEIPLLLLLLFVLSSLYGEDPIRNWKSLFCALDNNDFASSLFRLVAFIKIKVEEVEGGSAQNFN